MDPNGFNAAVWPGALSVARTQEVDSIKGSPSSRMSCICAGVLPVSSLHLAFKICFEITCP